MPHLDDHLESISGLRNMERHYGHGICPPYIWRAWYDAHHAELLEDTPEGEEVQISPFFLWSPYSILTWRRDYGWYVPPHWRLPFLALPSLMEHMRPYGPLSPDPSDDEDDDEDTEDTESGYGSTSPLLFNMEDP